MAANDFTLGRLATSSLDRRPAAFRYAQRWEIAIGPVMGALLDAVKAPDGSAFREAC